MSHIPFGTETNSNDISRRTFLMGSAGLTAIAGLPGATSATPTASQAKATTAKWTGDTVTTKDGIQIYYKDWGTGQPIVLSQGWPLSKRSSSMFNVSSIRFANWLGQSTS